MAVAPVKSIGIIGLMSDLDKVIRVCGDSQIFHPDEASNFYSDTKNFIPLTDRNPYSDLLADLKEILDMAGIRPSLVDIKRFQANEAQLSEYVGFLTRELGCLLAKQAECEQKIEQCKRSIEETSHFLGIDLEMDKISACRYVKTTFGRLPKESFEKLKNYSSNPYLVFFPCTRDDTHYWGVYIAPIDQSEEIDRIFSNLFFERYDISDIDSTPERHYVKLNNALATLQKDLEKATAEVEFFKESQLGMCNKYYSKLSALDTCYNIRKNVLKYHKSFILVGWIPQEEESGFLKKLNAISSVECTVSDGKDELKHSPPIKLKNNIFTRPFEFFVDMYGLPCYNEIDPTAFVAITFTVLFGIMFGDLGQGICVSIAGYLMWKLKKLAVGKILVPCGISSAIFGCVYGSVFGYEHALDPAYKALGFAEKPFEVMENAMTLIFAAVAIGVTLVCISMFLNMYSSLKRRDFENGLFGASGLAGFIFYASLIGGAVIQLVFGLPVMNLPYVLCLIILPLVLIFLREPLGKLVARKKNWKPESWGEYCMQNAFELLETLLSYVTNTMSFLRVGAFVLVHAGMMLVVFTLADLGMKALGIPGYVVIVILGNIFIMALEALLVCIQVLRIEFYEMFSRFYIGAGRKFDPVRVKEP